MTSKTAHAQITDIIKDVQMPVTPTTIKWFESLYESGAIIYEPSGAMRLSPKVREAISAMHHILGGGEVKIVIEREGDKTFDALEELFDRSMEEASTANEFRDGESDLTPYAP